MSVAKRELLKVKGPTAPSEKPGRISERIARRIYRLERSGFETDVLKEDVKFGTVEWVNERRGPLPMAQQHDAPVND